MALADWDRYNGVKGQSTQDNVVDEGRFALRQQAKNGSNKCRIVLEESKQDQPSEAKVSSRHYVSSSAPGPRFGGLFRADTSTGARVDLVYNTRFTEQTQMVVRNGKGNKKKVTNNIDDLVPTNEWGLSEFLIWETDDVLNGRLLRNGSPVSPDLTIDLTSINFDYPETGAVGFQTTGGTSYWDETELFY